MAFQDIICEKADGIATITMNRPEVLNAFRGQTVDELIEAFRDAWHDRTIGVVILTGAATARSARAAINRCAAAAATAAG